MGRFQCDSPRCAECGRSEDADLTCSKCKSVVYCSRSCQRAHWKKHKKDCTELATQSDSILIEATLTVEPQFLEWLDLWLRARPALLDGDAGVVEVVSSTAPVRRKSLECAGRAFLEGYERCMESFRPADAPEGPVTLKEEVRSGSRVSVHNRSCPRRTKPYLQRCQERAERRSKLQPGKELSRRLRGVELYTLLEINVDLVDGFPSMDQVKDAYRKLVLIHHPDKKESKSLAFQLIQEAYEYLSDPENKQIYDSTLPFDDSIPSRSELRSRGFFKTLEKVFQRNARFSEGADPVPELGAADSDLEKVYDFYEYWYNFESWRDVSVAFLEKHALELEDIQDCSRHERRARQKHNEQIRKLRLMRIVDLAWQNDPRLRWVSLKKAPAEPPVKVDSAPAATAADGVGSEAPLPGSVAQQLAEKLADEEKRKQDELKKIAKVRRQDLKRLVESLGLLVSGVELEKFCLKAPGDAEELEDLAEEVQRLANLPPEDVTEELTETDEDEKKSKKVEETEVPSCTFCNGTGLNCVSKHSCMFCDGTGKQKVEPVAEQEEQPVKEKKYRRKTPKQLAQEAIFDAIWASGMRPTETRHSPELRQARQERQEREREERRLRREHRLKAEKQLKEAWRNAKPEKKVEMCDLKSEKKVSMCIIPEVVEINEEPDKAWRYEEKRKLEEAEDVLSSLEHDTNPETVDKIAKLTEFARMGIEGSTQVILASLVASHELRLLLGALEERRVDEPDNYADEVLLLLSECVAPFFALGLRAKATAPKLPAVLRNRVKRVRQALRDLVLGCDFLAVLDGHLNTC